MISEIALGADGLWRPAYDEKLRQVDSWVADVDVALAHCKQRRTCIQAGGAYGVWPLYLAKHFETVGTFEPDTLNYLCLTRNIAGLKNVWALNAALGSAESSVSIKRDAAEANNAGAGYVAVGDEVPLRTIDSLKLSTVDLIALDVEGYELLALMGARETIEACKPVVMLEAKPLPQMQAYGVNELSAVEWLEIRGYRIVARAHRDVVMVPC